MVSALTNAVVYDLRESTTAPERRMVRHGGRRLSLPISAPRIAVSPEEAPSRPERGDEAVLLALVERIRQDDLTAFERLYQLTREDAARTLFHLVGRRVELEDLLQETYLRLLKAVKSFRGESKFRTFLYRVCANVALSHLRWRRRRPEDVMDALPERASTGPSPEDDAFAQEAKRLVEAALEGLTAKKRIVFVYHELCGMGPEEISKAVGTSPNTVRSRLHHARLEFNEAMQRLLALEENGGAHGLRR